MVLATAVQRYNRVTVLADPAPHTRYVQRQSRLAQHPDPAQRTRASTTAPGRRDIDRAIQRTLTLNRERNRT